MSKMRFKMMSKPGRRVGPGQARQLPVYRMSGIRHEDGVNLIQAFLCNVGTCRSDVKGEIQVEDPQE